MLSSGKSFLNNFQVCFLLFNISRVIPPPNQGPKPSLQQAIFGGKFQQTFCIQSITKNEITDCNETNPVSET